MVQNIYALTPLQEGILFHSLNRELSETPYFEEMDFNINGEFDIEIFTQSWNKIIERYDVFRTIFVHKNTPSPKQVVLKKGKIDLLYEDISAEKNRDKYIKDFIEKNRQLYFDLSKKSPLRVKVFKLNINSYRVIFAFHHILMDGWSGGIVFSELFSIYNALKNRVAINLPPVKPYSEYIKWLKKQDPSHSRVFWKNYLDGYDKGAYLPQSSNSNGYESGKQIFIIDKIKTNKVNKFVQEHGLTLNTLIQTIWGLTVAKVTKQNDIVFGATVSGRVDEIIGIEKMVGLFINAIPIRVEFSQDDTLLNVVKSVTQHSLEAKNHHYYSLADIQSLTPVKDKLIEQLLVFQNYPSTENTSSDIGFEIEDLEAFNQTNYNLDITIIPDDEMSVMFKYNSLLYSKSLIEELQNNFLELVDLYIQKPQTVMKSIINISTKTLFVSSTFTADLIEDGFSFWAKKFDIDVEISFSGYNQVMQDLLDINSPIYRKNGINLLLVRFEDVLRFLNIEDNSKKIEQIENNFNKIISTIKNSNFYIPTFIGVFKPIKNNLSDKLSELYNKMIITLKDKENIFIIDFRELDKLYQVENIFDNHSDKTGHIPFTDEYFWAMGSFISRQIHALYNPHFKVIALDCDNTIWGGIVGEDGAMGVDISGGYLELQKFVIEREKEGFLIVLNSKNNENDVWELFDKNSYMLLKKEHIVHSKINWQPKSQNLKEMAKELNLGLNSFVFLDDNPLECSEVITNAPEVLTLPLPRNPDSFKSFLGHIWALDKLKITKEDKTRTKMYQAETQREQNSQKLSLDDFLASLDLKIYMNEMLPSQLARTAQLTQRTNQFNVSTIRRDENDIEQIIKDTNSVCWTINVEDKFGSYGLVGVVITNKKSHTLDIDTFLMSCRVLGRGVEKSILAGLKQYAKEHHLNRVEMSFYPTKKNKPALNFIEENFFDIEEVLDNKTIYQLSVDALPEVASFVSFHFNEGITTLKNEQRNEVLVSTSTTEIESIEITNFDDFDFNFLETLPLEDKKNIEHIKFYEPIIYHKASDSKKLLLQNSKNLKSIEKFIAPQNKNQKLLSGIYQELLNIKSIGIKDNFFELGGHSLLATRVLSRVYQAFKVSLTLKDIFDNPTIESLEKLLQNGKEDRRNNIVKAPIMDNYPLSIMQKRVWLIDKMGGGVAYSMPIALEVFGKLDIKKLSFTFNTMIQRHEILRTKIIIIDGEPRQEIVDNLELDIVISKAEESKVIDEIEQDIYKVFDLSNSPLFRLKVYKIKKKKYIIYFNMNHIISDGWSIGVITKEITALYNNQSLPTLTLQYKDFSFWQNNLLSSTEFSEDRDYWYNKLKQKVEPLDFPTDYPRFKEQTFNGRTTTLNLTKELENINKFNKEQQITLFIFLVTSIKIILARYTMQEDILLGYPISGRESIELENQIGFYANTLILRDSINFEDNFTTLLHQIKNSVLEANVHQHYPFEKLLEELNIKRDLSRSPLFDYTISLNGDDGEMLSLGKADIKPFNFNFNMAQFDMSFNFISSPDSLYLNLNYNSDLFKELTINRFSKHINKIIKSILKKPNIKIKDINFLSKNEVKNEFRVSTLKDSSIVKLFQNQSRRKPNSIALIFDNTNLSYKDLDDASNKVANSLIKEFNIKPNDRVAFSLDRSLTPIVILAILKVGATFIPINPALPKDKIDYILDDAEVKLFINRSSLIENIKYSEDNIFKGNSDLTSSAYIIYTSGTTGNPKGVEVSQKSLLNLIHWYIADFNIDENSKALLMIPTSFDASIKNILAPLLVGGEVIIANDKFDPFSIIEYIEQNSVNLINCVPSAFNAILDASNREYNRLKSIKYLAFGGENLDLSLFKDFYFNNTVKLFNIYGPTEATDISTIYEIKKEDFKNKTVPIGKAISNSRVYIIDKFNNIVPIGVTGELIIAGDGVAKGYIKNIELTNNNFLTSSEFGRYYKTGDLAKVSRNGNIEFLGRVDDQVKIRGNRVELKEIEYQLMAREEIDVAIVLAKENRLVGYIKYKNNNITLDELKSYLKDRLVSYMLPSEFITIKNIPLTSNGKIDKKSLLSIKIDTNKSIDNYKLNSLDKKILQVFKNILDRKITIDDNFFEVGGDSLNGVKLISSINQQFNRKLKLSYLFENQTIKEFISNLDMKISNKPYKIFNKDKKKAIFIFPALIDSMDYTITPKKLSKYLNDYRIYALDFIWNNNRIEEYISIINSLEKDFIFLGYSSGGNLAFEVSKKIKRSPQKLILLDSWKLEKKNSIRREDALLEFKRENLEVDYNIVDRYIEMLNGMNNTKQINNDIDIILFTKDYIKFTKGINQNWVKSTNKVFRDFIGFGNHSNMLKDDNLIKNCQIINQIIRGEKNED